MLAVPESYLRGLETKAWGQYGNQSIETPRTDAPSTLTERRRVEPPNTATAPLVEDLTSEGFVSRLKGLRQRDSPSSPIYHLGCDLSMVDESPRRDYIQLKFDSPSIIRKYALKKLLANAVRRLSCLVEDTALPICCHITAALRHFLGP